MRIKIENLPGFEKDFSVGGGKESGVILNSDPSGLAYYRKQKENINRMDKIERDVNALKSDVGEILKLLKANN